MKSSFLIASLVVMVTCGIALCAQPPTSQQLTGSEGPRVIRGTVEEVHPFKLKEIAEPQLLAKVRTSDGDLIVASVGSANTFRAGLIERGTKVGMLGQTGAINGKEVFFAQRVDTQPPTTQPSAATTKPAAR